MQALGYSLQSFLHLWQCLNVRALLPISRAFLAMPNSGEPSFLVTCVVLWTPYRPVVATSVEVIVFLPVVILRCGFPPIIQYLLFFNLSVHFHAFSSLSHQFCLKLSRVAACLAHLGSPFHISPVPRSKGILSWVFSCESSKKALPPSFLFHAHCP